MPSRSGPTASERIATASGPVSASVPPPSPSTTRSVVISPPIGWPSGPRSRARTVRDGETSASAQCSAGTRIGWTTVRDSPGWSGGSAIGYVRPVPSPELTMVTDVPSWGGRSGSSHAGSSNSARNPATAVSPRFQMLSRIAASSPGRTMPGDSRLSVTPPLAAAGSCVRPRARSTMSHAVSEASSNTIVADRNPNLIVRIVCPAESGASSSISSLRIPHHPRGEAFASARARIAYSWNASCTPRTFRPPAPAPDR